MTQIAYSIHFPGYPPTSTFLLLQDKLQCPALQETIKNPTRVIPCGHIFDSAYISGKKSCPIDKSPIDTQVVDERLLGIINEIKELELSIVSKAADTEKLIRLGQQIDAVREESLSAEAKANRKALEKDALNYEEAGLYLIGTCKRDNCAAKGKVVWLNQKVGQFAFPTSFLYKTQCPTCEELMGDQINSIAVLGSKFSWEGRRGTGERCSGEGSGIKRSWTIFPDLGDWRFLNIQVEEEKLKGEVDRTCGSVLFDLAKTIAFFVCCCGCCDCCCCCRKETTNGQKKV